ncbi:MAG: hypothetical protein HXX81_00575 [Campylobacterales bacterium]|nr:hypothetical protein [Campylobacterales bacterium]
MYKVIVENPCRCFLRSGLSDEFDFSSPFEAQMKADELKDEMQKNFCKKHSFRVEKSYDGKTYKVVISLAN